MIRGEKVILRPIEREDVEIFLKWFNDPEITQYLLFGLPITREKEEKWIEETNLSEDSVVFVVESIGDFGQLNFAVGNCGLHSINWVDRSATIGIAIGEKDCQRKGYGFEALNLLIKYAFETLNLNRISSSVVKFNEASLKLHQKLGFVVDGIRRKAKFRNGDYHDEIILGLLREDWRKVLKW